MPHPWKIRQAADIILRGGLIAYPTEAVFGLGCNPYDQAAVLSLLRLKQRPWSKGLILVACCIEQLLPLIDIPSPAIRQKMLASWPGPITWVVPAQPNTPTTLTGAHSTLAVRVSAHPVVQALCRELDQPLVSTSANRESMPPARSALAVQRLFGQHLDCILHGSVNRAAQPSEIRDARTDRILRPA